MALSLMDRFPLAITLPGNVFQQDLCLNRSCFILVEECVCMCVSVCLSVCLCLSNSITHSTTSCFLAERGIVSYMVCQALLL